MKKIVSGSNFQRKLPLELRLKDLLEKNVHEKYYLSEAAINRLLRKESYIPEINPEITGTLNTKNNSGQLSMDKGTTLITDEFQRANQVIVDNDNGNLREVDVSTCIDSNYAKGMDNHSQRSMILEDDGILFNKENTALGYTECEPGDSINLSNPNSKTRRGRVGKQVAQTLDTACNQAVLLPLFGTESNSQGARIYDAEGLSVTQTSGGGGMGVKTGLYLIDRRIRRLTPRECFRLQGYSDDFFDKCQSVNSDTQLYKQAGNSISVDTFVNLLIQILIAIKIPFKNA